MYKIKIDDSQKCSLSGNYLKKYKEKLREEIQGFLDGKEDFVFKRSVGTSDKKTFTFKVCSNPKSFTCQFLEECFDPKKTLLDDLLTGDVNAQIAVINRVYQKNPANLEKLTAAKARQLGYSDGDVVDDFNTIMNEIFAKRSFEGQDAVHALPLDKDEFVKNLEIRICPYCGRSYIYRVVKQGKNGDVSVKPQLDHFLPKSDYPFLGMNFFNLIPCCTQCNMAPCKVDNDPLDGNRKRIVHLMHPYDFDDTKARFFYQMNAPDTYKPESYDVMVGYENKDLKKGYNGFLALDKLYAGHNIEVCNMFLRARAFSVATNGLYSGLGLGKASVSLLAQAVLGFNLNEIEERRQLMYKFWKDTFLQMAGKKHIPAITYLVDWEGKEISITV